MENSNIDVNRRLEDSTLEQPPLKKKEEKITSPLSLDNQKIIHSQKNKPLIDRKINKESIFSEPAKELGKSQIYSSPLKGKDEIQIEETGEIGVNLNTARIVIDKFVESQIAECKKELPPSKFENCKTLKEEKKIVENWLSDEKRLTEGKKPRMELRKVPGTEGQVIANIALIFANGSERDAGYEELKKEFPDISLVSAGQTTVEIGTRNVSKATTINYVANHFDEILEQMDYIPGPLIDAKKTKSVIISDADGTIWDPPQRNENPEARNLSNSPAKESVLNYLRAGGVLILNSGNDPTRTMNRIMLGIPEGERDVLVSRIVVGAAGGHTLMTLRSDSEPKEIEGYRKHALHEQEHSSINPASVLDVIYLGDDPREKGNDFQAFVKVGQGHYICVASEEKQLPEFVQLSTVRGEAKATQNIISTVVKRAVLLPQKPLFEEVSIIHKIGQNAPKAQELISNTLNVFGGREGVNEQVAYNDSHNGPVLYQSENIDQLLTIYDQTIRQKYTTKDDPTKAKEKITLDYETLLQLNEEYVEELKNRGINHDSLCNNFQIENPSFETYMQETLDRMDLKNGNIIRIFEPGNNDQTTPMFVAKQIEFILNYAREKNIALNVQVLVMGKGGHAGTALFPLIGELHNNIFTGTTEAESLGDTLVQSLKEYGINSSVVEKFDEHNVDEVQIKLAKESKNTGENVQEAIDCLLPGEQHPEHVLVSSAKVLSVRQSLTFAQQYSLDKSQPLAQKNYTTLTSVPIFRTKEFIETAMNDEQAVTEFYMGVAEECRIIQYGFNPDQQFIPPSPIEKERLDYIYSCYDLLTGRNNLEESKKVPINTVLSFFTQNCVITENAMTWNKKLDDQTEGTKNAVAALMRRQKQKAEFASSVKLYDELRLTPGLSDEAAKNVATYGKLLTEFRASTDDREKWVLASLMISVGKKMEAALTT